MGWSSPQRDAQIKELIHNPPNLDEALSYVHKLDNPDYQLFEKLIEVVANSVKMDVQTGQQMKLNNIVRTIT